MTQTDNLKNKSKSKRNSSGFTGVYQTITGKWIARICINWKVINLGTFENVQDAILAKKLANIQYQFHSNHGN